MPRPSSLRLTCASRLSETLRITFAVCIRALTPSTRMRRLGQKTKTMNQKAQTTLTVISTLPTLTACEVTLHQALRPYSTMALKPHEQTRSLATPIRGAVTARLDTVTPWPVMSHRTGYGSFT